MTVGAVVASTLVRVRTVGPADLLYVYLWVNERVRVTRALPELLLIAPGCKHRATPRRRVGSNCTVNSALKKRKFDVRVHSPYKREAVPIARHFLYALSTSMGPCKHDVIAIWPSPPTASSYHTIDIL